MFRVELSVGVGLQAGAMATELVHVGAGSSRRYTAGLFYGDLTSEKRIEDHFPLSYVWTLIDPDARSLHSLRWGPGDGAAQHRCFLVFPGELNRSSLERDLLHYWDVEANVFAAVLGVEVGFSLGELVDFLLGLVTVDIAGDDGYDNRLTRKIWRPVPEHSGEPVRPR
jgi:hypothetical protein